MSKQLLSADSLSRHETTTSLASSSSSVLLSNQSQPVRVREDNRSQFECRERKRRYKLKITPPVSLSLSNLPSSSLPVPLVAASLCLPSFFRSFQQWTRYSCNLRQGFSIPLDLCMIWPVSNLRLFPKVSVLRLLCRWFCALSPVSDPSSAMALKRGHSNVGVHRSIISGSWLPLAVLVFFCVISPFVFFFGPGIRLGQCHAVVSTDSSYCLDADANR